MIDFLTQKFFLERISFFFFSYIKSYSSKAYGNAGYNGVENSQIIR